jgi:ABC-type antimicrobial peptide transport system permease subunit
VQLDYNAIIVALIVAVPPTVLSLINRGKLQDIHIDMNSRLSQLITASKALGAQEERDKK